MIMNDYRVLNFYEEIAILKVDYLISEDFNMNDYIAICLGSEG